jgi:hypothetical protein
VPRQLHGNPPLHALALDEDNLSLERHSKGLTQNLGKLLSQDLKLVAGEKIQSGHYRRSNIRVDFATNSDLF